MLTLYRRHTRSCGQKDRYYRRCKCPMWVEGTTDVGEYIRHSLKLTSWERAEEKKRELEARPDAPPTRAEPVQAAHGITLREATEKFCRECEARRLGDPTMRKYRTLAKQLREFADSRFVYLNEFTIELAREFRASWKDGPRAAGKKLERLRAFFRFSVENGWIEDSPTKHLKAPIVKDKPTLPFSREDMARILEHAAENRLFILTMRYTGMRISDTAMLQASAVNGNKVFLYTHKTGVPVHVPIPDFVANELASIRPAGGYLFLRGESTRLETCTDLWRRQIARVFKAAKIPKGHPHRFRDTFAVELLLSGVPIEHVSVLLGHSSVKITEKHYAPWVRTRQEKLEEDVQKSWGQLRPTLVKSS
jgi:integrase/recombinase XerD